MRARAAPQPTTSTDDDDSTPGPYPARPRRPKSLALTTLKVDRPFVDGLGQDPYATSIVEAIVALGRALGMRVHAEGVERADQLDELRRVGCDDAQGWLWAPWMTSGDFEDWMETRQS